VSWISVVVMDLETFDKIGVYAPIGAQSKEQVVSLFCAIFDGFAHLTGLLDWREIVLRSRHTAVALRRT